jgi:hypothetical protein
MSGENVSKRSVQLLNELDQCLSYDLPSRHVEAEIEEMIVTGAIPAGIRFVQPVPGVSGVSEILC